MPVKLPPVIVTTVPAGPVVTPLWPRTWKLVINGRATTIVSIIFGSTASLAFVGVRVTVMRTLPVVGLVQGHTAAPAVIVTDAQPDISEAVPPFTLTLKLIEPLVAVVAVIVRVS